MEKYKNIIKIEEVRRLAANKDYKKAALIIDSMNIKKIKAIIDLTTIADVLTQNQRYEEATKVLNKVYTRTQSRRVVNQLLEVSIRRKDLPLAKKYYGEYIELAPRDPWRFIFKYLLLKLEDKPIEEQITQLEELKNYEYIEEWAYELAALYHKAGMEKECIKECNNIILWFATGEYVKRAELLKDHYEGKIDLLDILKEKQLEEQEQKEVREENEEDIDEKEKEEPQEDTQEEMDILEEYFQGIDIDYKEIFANFLNNIEIKQQIVKILEEVDNKRATYLNLIISSDKSVANKESEKVIDMVSFAKALLKALYRLNMIKCEKVGMIDAKDFNSIDYKRKKKVIKNCSLIIENASFMEEQAVDDLEELILDKNQKILVVLLDDERKMNELFEEHPQLFLYFHNRVML